MSGIKRGSSSRTSLEYFQPNLKKQRIDLLSFSSTFTSSSSSSSVISGKQIRVPPVNSKLETPSLTKTSEINELIDGEKRSNLGSGGSDSKAARVEMLKKRFSRIIVKAAQLQEDGSIDLKLNDSVKMQMRKEILMEKKLKEAQIAAEAESKREIQRKREAARKALLELERTVEVNDNIKTMKDFAMLLGYPRNCAACVSNEIGWHGLCFSSTSRTSEWRKR